MKKIIFATCLTAFLYTIPAQATELTDASEAGDKVRVEQLLAAGVNVGVKDDYGDTPLILAVKNNKTEIVKLLLARRADVNEKDSNGWSPLILSLFGNDTDLVKLLIEGGADLNAIGNHGWTVLHYAARGQVKQGGQGGDEEISSLDYKDIVQRLLVKGAAINAKNSDGETPLLQAVDNGNTEVVELLLAQGADINAKDDLGRKPQHLVESISIAKLLLAGGIDVNAATDYKQTLLHVAASRNMTELVKILVKKGADINAKNDDGETPAMLADDEEIKKLLTK